MLTILFEQITESVIQSLWTMTVLHRSFILYDELCLLKNLMEILIPCDITAGRLIDGDRHFIFAASQSFLAQVHCLVPQSQTVV